jgi:hypothetical protein
MPDKILLDECANFVSHTAVMSQRFFLGRR